MVYTIFDIRDGLLGNDSQIEADCPKQALVKAGYKDIQRDYTGTGSVVVSNNRSSYVYNATR